MGLSGTQLQELTRRSATADAAAECLVYLDGVARLIEQEADALTPEELVDVLVTACGKLGTALAQDCGHASTYFRLQSACDGIQAAALLSDAGLSGELEE